MQKLKFKEPIYIKQAYCDIIQDCHGKENSAKLSAPVNEIPDYPSRERLLAVKVQLSFNGYDLVPIFIGSILIAYFINKLFLIFLIFILAIFVFAYFLPWLTCLTHANLYFVDAGSPLPKNLSLKEKDKNILHLAIRITNKRIQNHTDNIDLDWFNKKSPISLKHKAILTIIYELLQKKTGYIQMINIFLKFARSYIFLFFLLIVSPFLVDTSFYICNIKFSSIYIFGVLSLLWAFYYMSFYPKTITCLLKYFEVMEKYDPFRSVPISCWDVKKEEWEEISYTETCEAKNLMVNYILYNEKLTNLLIGFLLTLYIALLQLL
ncbi:MAG: hypothetical protein ORN21_05895 [Methylophilaceae bacterium]|nr:hypothetical protein [Methylophilaceae bacterium]